MGRKGRNTSVCTKAQNMFAFLPCRGLLLERILLFLRHLFGLLKTLFRSLEMTYSSKRLKQSSSWAKGEDFDCFGRVFATKALQVAIIWVGSSDDDASAPRTRVKGSVGAINHTQLLCILLPKCFGSAACHKVSLNGPVESTRPEKENFFPLEMFIS